MTEGKNFCIDYKFQEELVGIQYVFYIVENLVEK